MAINYDDDPRYEFLEDNVYFDTQTNETVIVLDEETSDIVRSLMALEDDVFVPGQVDDEVILTNSGAKKLFGGMLKSQQEDEDTPTD